MMNFIKLNNYHKDNFFACLRIDWYPNHFAKRSPQWEISSFGSDGYLDDLRSPKTVMMVRSNGFSNDFA